MKRTFEVGERIAEADACVKTAVMSGVPRNPLQRTRDDSARQRIGLVQPMEAMGTA